MAKGGGWITINGTHVMVDGGGRVVAGPSGLKGGGSGGGSSSKGGGGSGNSESDITRSKYFQSAYGGSGDKTAINNVKKDIPEPHLRQISDACVIADMNPTGGARINMNSHDVYVSVEPGQKGYFHISIRGRNGNRDLSSPGIVKESQVGFHLMDAYKSVCDNYGKPRAIITVPQKKVKTAWGTMKWEDDD